jgi:hypothetical protein
MLSSNGGKIKLQNYCFVSPLVLVAMVTNKEIRISEETHLHNLKSKVISAF